VLRTGTKAMVVDFVLNFFFKHLDNICVKDCMSKIRPKWLVI
jgi:hypothetical protein